jgi:hypothetical protein
MDLDLFLDDRINSVSLSFGDRGKKRAGIVREIN